VLDGVAVYTWSGSAWTPASGTATPATPSGALRGVAAFSWDGAAWQPAAQARPSVPTPYGVLDGVAIFEWGGSSWQAGAAVPAGATLDLSFMSGTLNPLLTFTRASTATYFDATGTMRTAATNAPRFDYDPVTHAALGLLIEEQRTNGIINSGAINLSWAPAAATLVGAAGVAPDGTNSATLVRENAANAVHNMACPMAIVAATAYAFSVYAKPAGRSIIYATGMGLGGAGLNPQWDVAAGADVSTGAAAGFTHGIQNVGNGWYRCWFTFTTTNTGGLGYNMATVAGGTAYQGDNVSGIYFWGAQGEASAAFPTSYIPTTAAAVTRSADQCSIQPAQMGFATSTSAAGSWMAEFVCNAFTAGNFQRVVYSPPISTATLVGKDATNHAFQYDIAIVLSTVNTITAGAVTKVASTWTAATGQICLNGGAVASAGGMTNGYAPVYPNGIGFMVAAGAAVENMTGYIRRVRYWPRVLSNAELQSVTT
jgi:hypothetical protein